MDPCLKVMLTQIINVKSPTDYDGPDEVLGPAREVKAHIQEKRNISGAPGGTELTTQTLIITEDPVTVDDRVWLPGLDPANGAFSRQPASVFIVPDPETGLNSHYETTI